MPAGWMDESRREVNSGQGEISSGVRSSKDPATYTTERVTGTVSRGKYGTCQISRP